MTNTVLRKWRKLHNQWFTTRHSTRVEKSGKRWVGHEARVRAIWKCVQNFSWTVFMGKQNAWRNLGRGW